MAIAQSGSSRGFLRRERRLRPGAPRCEARHPHAFVPDLEDDAAGGDVVAPLPTVTALSLLGSASRRVDDQIDGDLLEVLTALPHTAGSPSRQFRTRSESVRFWITDGQVTKRSTHDGRHRSCRSTRSFSVPGRAKCFRSSTICSIRRALSWISTASRGSISLDLVVGHARHHDVVDDTGTAAERVKYVLDRGSEHSGVGEHYLIRVVDLVSHARHQHAQSRHLVRLYQLKLFAAELRGVLAQPGQSSSQVREQDQGRAVEQHSEPLRAGLGRAGRSEQRLLNGLDSRADGDVRMACSSPSTAEEDPR